MPVGENNPPRGGSGVQRARDLEQSSMQRRKAAAAEIEDLKARLEAAEKSERLLAGRVAELIEENNVLTQSPGANWKRLEIVMENGGFDAVGRADWVRAFATAFYDVFQKEKGVNFLEWTFNPQDESQLGIGPLILRMERKTGLTPSECLSDYRAWIARRFRQIKPEEIQNGQKYIVLLSKNARNRWQVAEGKVTVTGLGHLMRSLFLVNPGTSLRAEDENILEVWQLRLPDEPRPERLPKNPLCCIVTQDTDCIQNDQSQYRDDSGNPVPVVSLRAGALAVVRKAEREPRWYIHIVGLDKPVSSFPDDGTEIPDWLEPVPE